MKALACSFSLRHQRERTSQRQQFPRPGGSERQFRQQPFEIQNIRQQLARFPSVRWWIRAPSCTASSRASISSSCKHGRSNRRAQQASAHAGAGLIQDMDQRGLAAFAREQRLQQLEIPNSDGVQNHRVAAVVVTTAGPNDRAPIFACPANSAGSRPPPRPPAACRPGRSHPASTGGNVRAARGRRSPG